jgi:hypothetical protein
VSAAPGNLGELARICRQEGVPSVSLGHTGGSSVRIQGLADVALAELDDAWRNGLERALARTE